MHVLCDWLSASQTHQKSTRQVRETINLTLDGETGAIMRESAQPLQHPGSFDTSIRISSNGNRVSLSGNVGRFGRPDNVFGHDLDACKRIANDILHSVGLPPFTVGTWLHHQSKGDKATRTYTGAAVSRVDMTTNWCAGQHAGDFIHWLGSQKLGRTKVSAWGDGETVYWGKNTKGKNDGKWINSKAYNKGLEIEARIKQKRRKRDVDDDHINYLTDLKNWCLEQGIVRHETMFCERFLNQRDFKTWDRCTTESIEAEYRKQLNQMTNRCEMSNHGSIPKKVKATFHDYTNGVNVRGSMSKATFYKHRRLLLQFGIDIAMPSKVRTLNIKPTIVKLEPATMPEFYQLPKVA